MRLNVETNQKYNFSTAFLGHQDSDARKRIKAYSIDYFFAFRKAFTLDFDERVDHCNCRGKRDSNPGEIQYFLHFLALS